MSERPFGHVPGHARHDRLLVARFAVGDAFAGETEQARGLIEQCSECARLADDIRLLQASVAVLPTPARTRNFRLTEAEAEELRGNAMQRFLRRLAMPGLTMLRPVAGVALAMGLTMAVVGGGLPLAAGAPASEFAPAPQATPETRDFMSDGGIDTAAGSHAPAAMPSPEGGEPGTQVGAPTSQDVPPVTTTDRSEDVRTDASDAPRASDSAYANPEDSDKEAGPVVPSLPGGAGSGDTTRLLLIYGGVSLAMVSFAVLLIAWYARRKIEDPLLR